MDNEKFLVESGLYDKMEVSYDDFADLVNLLSGKQKIDLYCSKCKEKRTFTAKINKIKMPKENSFARCTLLDFSDQDSEAIYESIKMQEQREEMQRFQQFLNDNAVTPLDYVCGRDETHQLRYILLIEENSIQKIGQYPSYADIDIPQSDIYRKELGDRYYGELKKAIGLYSCNVGIGSFVYLRRILEKLIMDALGEAIKEGTVTQEDFDFVIEGEKKHQRRVEDKIKLLASYLPDVLTENKAIYGVISKGIHELEEKECLRYFPIVEQIIKMCLEEVIEIKRKKKASVELRKQLAAISTEIKKK